MDKKIKDNMTDLTEMMRDTNSEEVPIEVNEGEVTDSDDNIITLGH